MTSALTQDWGAGAEGLSELIDTFGGPNQNQVNDPDEADANAMSAQQEVARDRRLELDRRWSWYRATQYDGRAVHWDGGKVFTHADAIEASASSQVPAGFWVSGQFSDAGSEPYPLRLRRPCAPVPLGRSIIQRFSGLLFGSTAHPTVASPGHKNTEDWLAAFITETRLWAKMLNGRAFGGAMGSFALGFKFVNGRPRVEIHDPRTALPVFRDRETLEVLRLDKRYTYEAIKPNADGVPVLQQCLYRRLITERADIVWPCVISEPGLEPEWAHEEHTVFRHDFGFAPIVWVQNIENSLDIDGDPDIHAIYDLLEQVDALRSQASVGAIANCDPTLVVTTDSTLPEGLRKGSSNAIELPAGSDAKYLELQGTSIKVALDTSDTFRADALATARCVLKSNDDSAPKTATEIERTYGEMFEQVDVLREQYGEQAVRKLLEMVLRAARVAEARGEMVRLRPNSDGSPRVLGDGEYVELTWPPHVEPDLEDVGKAVISARDAVQANLIPIEEGTRFVAPYFKIEDAQAAHKTATEEAMQHEDEAMRSVLDEQESYPEEQDDENFSSEVYDRGVDDLSDEELGLDPMEDLADPAETAAAEAAAVDQVQGGTVIAPTLSKDPSAALNGAQVSSLLEIVTQVSARMLPVASAHAILMVAFPLTEIQASAILDPVAAILTTGSTVQTPALPSPDEADPAAIADELAAGDHLRGGGL